MLQYNSTHAISMAQSGLRTGSLSIENPSLYSRSKDLTIKWSDTDAYVVVNMLQSPLVSSLLWRRQPYFKGLVTMIYDIPAQKPLDITSKKLEGQSLFKISSPHLLALPKLRGSSLAFQIPIPNMPVRPLTCPLEKVAKFNDIKKMVSQVPQGSLKVILGYTED
ncbi:Glyceraldehyde-3-phosphate dehydrogenase [Galemys pyrenaicus]|uniref:Glyceraldehyde-3-phosphate dehydrogenase n=1 Tax=Galemys pyrenaicus TaxID=202257 RepID=A0A8J6E2B2_GALPY|nr:Glyceraldehyde-3-phosphate dehydrogenase [Galemys pyrenaicus]